MKQMTPGRGLCFAPQIPWLKQWKFARWPSMSRFTMPIKNYQQAKFPPTVAFHQLLAQAPKPPSSVLALKFATIFFLTYSSRSVAVWADAKTLARTKSDTSSLRRVCGVVKMHAEMRKDVNSTHSPDQIAVLSGDIVMRLRSLRTAPQEAPVYLTTGQELPCVRNG